MAKYIGKLRVFADDYFSGGSGRCVDSKYFTVLGGPSFPEFCKLWGPSSMGAQIREPPSQYCENSLYIVPIAKFVDGGENHRGKRRDLGFLVWAIHACELANTT